jgi:predicted phosphodiesterase
MVKIIEKLITLEDKNKPLRIIPIGDIHLGAYGTNTIYLKNTVEWIKNEPNCYVVGMGDYCDCIVPQDTKRFDITAIDPSFLPHLDNLPMTQLAEIKKILLPIKDKIICMIPGNHEESMRKYHSLNLLREFELDFKVPIGDYMTFLRLKFDREQFHTTPLIFFLQHGWFAGRKVGGKINQLMDSANSYGADIYIVGHSHYLGTEVMDRVSIAAKGFGLLKEKKVFVSSGTFLETISLNASGYSEKKAYPPAKIGTARIDIYLSNNKRPDIHVRI